MSGSASRGTGSAAPGGNLPAVVLGLLDDAAMFPPGLAPLPEAVAAHVAHTRSWYGGLVGPLVVAAPTLAKLPAVLGGRDSAWSGAAPLPLAVTFPDGPARLADALDAVAALPVTIEALEIVVPAGLDPGELVRTLDDATAPSVTAFVEVPRDERRDPVLAALTGTRHHAKFRTGGVRAQLYPDEAELASAVRAAVRADVSFKATAGLHHAVRNTDPATGFEQHGFLNLLLATEAADRGAEDGEVRELLAEREGAVVARRVRGLGPDRVAAVRARFRSFGTCSITDPLTELAGLGLVEVPEGAA